MSRRPRRRAAERTPRKLARVQNPAQANPQATSQDLAVPRPFESIPQPQDFRSASFPAIDINLKDLLSDEVEPLHFEPLSFSPVETQLAEPQRSEASQSQIAANQANAKFSTGAITAEGKATVSQNRRSHGLTGVFQLLRHERRQDLDLLKQSVYDEYQPQTDTELRLADDMIQHYWLAQRALFLQQHLMDCADHPVNVDQKQLSLFLRYQTTHERSYYKALRELQNLKKQQSKPEIGFESQNADSEAVQAKLEATQAKTRLINARAKAIEIETSVRQGIVTPRPGATNIPFDESAKGCGAAIARETYKHQTNQEPKAA